MPPMTDFFNRLKYELTEESNRPGSEFISRFNNDYRHKKGKFKPRTNLMLGVLEDLGDGIVPRALMHFFVQERHRILKEERDFDISVFDIIDPDTGNPDPENIWYSGKRIPLLIAEVEGDLDEFKGTLSDLIPHQARSKVGVFYQDLSDPVQRRKRENEIKDVMQHWRSNGFRDLEGTEYLIIFGPQEIWEGIGQWHAFWFKSDANQLTYLT